MLRGGISLVLRRIALRLLGFALFFQTGEVEGELHDLSGNPAILIRKGNIARFSGNLLLDDRSPIPVDGFRQIGNDGGDLGSTFGRILGEGQTAAQTGDENG